MFPIPWNFPFRKKNGDMSTIGAEIGGAGSELPPHGASDAGKLLGVKANGSLEWSDTVNSEIQTLTNKVDGLTEQLNNGYSRLVGLKTFVVSSDNVKNYGTLLNELFTNIKNYVLESSTNKLLVLNSVTMQGWGSFNILGISAYSGGDTIAPVAMSQADSNGTDVITRFIHLNTSGSQFLQYSYSTATVVDQSASVPPTGYSFTAYVFEYASEAS